VKPFDKIPRKRVQVDPEDLATLKIAGDIKMELFTATDYEDALSKTAALGPRTDWAEFWEKAALNYADLYTARLLRYLGVMESATKAHKLDFSFPMAYQTYETITTVTFSIRLDAQDQTIDVLVSAGAGPINRYVVATSHMTGKQGSPDQQAKVDAQNFIRHAQRAGYTFLD